MVMSRSLVRKRTVELDQKGQIDVVVTETLELNILCSVQKGPINETFLPTDRQN